jgi:hypothetical protein
MPEWKAAHSACSLATTFCMQPGHHIQECPSTQEYVHLGQALILEDQLSLLNGQPIPNDGTGQGLKHGIDSWLVTQTQAAPAPVTQVTFTHEATPHLFTPPDNCASTAHIEEVTEYHMFQAIGSKEDIGLSEEDPIDLFQVLATEKKKQGARCSNLPEMQPSICPSTQLALLALVPAEFHSPIPVSSTAAPTATTSATTSAPPWTALQYWHQSTVEDQQLISKLESWLMEGKLA